MGQARNEIKRKSNLEDPFKINLSRFSVHKIIKQKLNILQYLLQDFYRVFDPLLETRY